MGREHRGSVPERPLELGGEPLEGGQRVRVEDEAAPGLNRRHHHGAGGGMHPERRAQDQGVQPLVLQDVPEPLRAVASPQHHGGEMGGVDSDRLRRRGHGDEARSDPQGRQGRKPRRAGPGRAAGADEGVAAVVFMGVRLRLRQQIEPQAWPVGEEVPARRREGVPADADVGHLDGPLSTRPGMRRWQGFRAAKVTVRVALTAIPLASPVSPSMPDGRSTARIGLAEAFMPSTARRAAPSRFRVSPVPNRASMMRSASAKGRLSTGSTLPFQSCAARAASPVRRSGLPRSPRETR
jgi:hypothetical protein